MEPDLLTLRQAASRTGYSRDALKQRVRRGSLKATKGNDGVLRIRVEDLAHLPPVSLDVPEGEAGNAERKALDVLADALDQARDDAERARDDAGQARREAEDAERRAGRLEERLAATEQRAGEALKRLERAEGELAELRRPWLLRLWRGFSGRA